MRQILKLPQNILPIHRLPQKFLNQVRQNKSVQQALLPFGRTLKPDKWVFIIGCYNSGTTLLENILSSHPQIGGLPLEGVALTDALPRPEEYGWARMWSKCFENVQLLPAEGMDKKAEHIKRQWSIWYPKGKPVLLEKSIANATRMQFLQEYFRPAYFIYIIRNGYAVSEGIRRKANLNKNNNLIYKNRYPIEVCAEQWKVSDEVVAKDSKNIHNFLQIYYEDLCSTPVVVLKTITEFLGLSSLPDQVLERHWDIHKKKSTICNMNDINIAGLSFNDKKQIKNMAWKTLVTHGYDADI